MNWVDYLKSDLFNFVIHGKNHKSVSILQDLWKLHKFIQYFRIRESVVRAFWPSLWKALVDQNLLNHGQLLNSLSEVLLDVINYYASKLIAHKPRNDIYRKNSAIKIHWKFQSLFRIKTTYWDELYLFPLLAVHCKTENKTIKDKIKIFLNKKMKITKCKDRERER